ncbi:MAG: sporulation protein YqfD [Sporomusaceae bacterium]|nr:sporulation protein YqfD [Sporomusaceae bacterium]
MTFNIRNYISGTVTIKVSGAMPEKFINLCMIEKKSLLSITKINDDFIVCMRLYDFFGIRPLVRKSKNRVQVVSYSGLPFVAKRIRRRKMLIVGGIAFIILLNVLMSYIWFIDIVGMQSIPTSHIKEIVYQHGLKPGTLRDAISAKKIEKQLLLSIPEIAWVSINFTGTRAVIEIVEKTMPKQQDKRPAHIIAAKDGIITDVIVLAGESAVKKGDTVKKGDVLIKGFVYEGKATDPAVETRVPQLIRSNGIVKARVWYEGYGETELVKTVYERSGKQDMSVTLKVGNYEIPLKRVAIGPQQAVEVEVFNKKLLWWRNSDIAVESSVSTYYEMNARPVIISIEEAREEGKAKALAEVQSLIPETAQVLSRTIEVLKTPETNLVRVKVNAETAEDIGQFMNIQ